MYICVYIYIYMYTLLCACIKGGEGRSKRACGTEKEWDGAVTGLVRLTDQRSELVAPVLR